MGSPTASADRARTIETHETHGSWVFLGDEHARKIKRPVKLAFLDYATLERRRATALQTRPQRPRASSGSRRASRPWMRSLPTVTSFCEPTAAPTTRCSS